MRATAVLFFVLSISSSSVYAASVLPILCLRFPAMCRGLAVTQRHDVRKSSGAITLGNSVDVSGNPVHLRIEEQSGKSSDIEDSNADDNDNSPIPMLGMNMIP